mgnify:FL=1
MIMRLGVEVMKRLLKISFDSLFFSLMPIIQWFLLGLLVDKNLINVFSITYPLQFMYSLIKSIFGVAPNIQAEKESNKNSVMSGLVLGIFFTFLIFGLFAINVGSFISFMHMDVHVYHNFCLFSIAQLGLHGIFTIMIEKLYYEEKNTTANVHTILFNTISIISLVIFSLITKNQVIIISGVLLIILMYLIIMFILEFNEFKMDFRVFRSIKYDSVDALDSVLFFFIYFFGLSNASTYGVEYLAALNFVALITDCQWDSFAAINEAAKIDLAKNKYDNRKSLKNAYCLLFILYSTIFLMFVIMYNKYELNLGLVAIYLSVEIFDLALYPIYCLKKCFLTLEYSSIKMTFNKFVASGIRVIASFLPTPFCTSLGQMVSSIYQLITANIYMKKFKKSKEKKYELRTIESGV